MMPRHHQTLLPNGVASPSIIRQNPRQASNEPNETSKSTETVCHHKNALRWKRRILLRNAMQDHAS